MGETGIKTFSIAADRKRGRKRKPIPFKLNENETEVYHIDPNASEEAFGIVAAEYTEAEEDRDGAGLLRATKAMMQLVFTDDTYRRLMARIRKGEIGLADLREPLWFGVEKITGRPTESQSD